jgi:hypothetical protein
MNTKREIRGKAHQCVVLKITGRYPDGRPKDAIFIHDDMKTDVENGTEFITAWVPTVTVEKRGKN